MNRIERTVDRLTRQLIAHEIPVLRLFWNPGLSPPFELFLDGEITPTEHHRALRVLLELWSNLTTNRTSTP